MPLRTQIGYRGLEICRGLGRWCTERLWNAAPDFDTLLSLNEHYIRGYLQQTPYHSGPLDDETCALVPQLLKMHKLGMLTVGSQPFQHEYQKLSRRDRRNELQGLWAERQQKPTVTFIVAQGGERARFSPEDLFEILYVLPNIKVRATRVQTGDCFSRSDRTECVSRNRYATTMEKLRTKNWENVTMGLAEYDRREEPFFELKATQLTDAVEFDVVAGEWGEDLDLLQKVINAAESCSLHHSIAL